MTGSSLAPDAVIGRQRDLGVLLELLDRARRGAGSLVWLVGEGGIGKTHLASALTEVARGERIPALSARADEFERHRPFGVIADCLRVPKRGDEHRERAAALLTGWVAGSEPGDQVREGGELELATREALFAVVDDLCADGVAVLVFEDLQWADQSSLHFVASLAGRVADMGVLVLCTSRRLPRREELERVVAVSRERGAAFVQLGALDSEACAAVAAQMLGSPPGERLSVRLVAAGGNPLFVRLLVEAMAADGELDRTADGRIEVESAGLPASLDVVVLGWLSSLPAQAVDALRLATVLGSSFTLADLSLLAGKPAAELWTSLRSALDAGALVDAGDHLEFNHDVVREALYRDMPQTVRAGLHLEFGRALASQGADAGVVAEHLLRGARRGDRQAVEWLERAARQASSRSAEVAAELLEAALELADEDDPERGRVLVELGLNLVAAARRQEGEEVCRRALEEAAYPPGEARLRLTLARSLLERAQLPEAMAEAELVAESEHASPEHRAEAISWQAAGSIMTHQFDVAEAIARRALEAGQASEAAALIAFPLSRLALIAGLRGEFEAAEELAAEAASVAEREQTRDTHHLSHAHLIHAMALADIDRPHDGITTVAHARWIYERLGMEETLRNSHHYAGYPQLFAGGWDDALAELETAAALSREAAISWTVDLDSTRAWIHVHRDELELAEELIDQATRALAAGAPSIRMGWTTWAQAMLADALGREREALETLWGAWTAATEAGAFAEQRTFAPELVRLLAAQSEAGRLGEVATAIEELSRGNPSLRTVSALAVRCRALAEGDDAELIRAAELHPDGIRPHDRGLALEDAAVALARAGERDRATEPADEALRIYGSLGATREAARFRGRLRAAGMRPAQRGSRQREESGWGSLTTSERRVAELAAEGLSNPQIAERLVVSRHTVVTHMSHVLGKLGLRSRYELAVARAQTEAEGAAED
jgi:DNA-binding NarL/FixJ family response regulator